MSRSICILFIPESFENAFLLIEEKLAQMSVSLKNPENERITTWNDDGEQLEIFPEQISGGAISGQVKNVQFWKSEEEDVFVSWKKSPSGWRFEFSLDGLSIEFVELLVADLMKIIFKYKYSECTAFSIEFE